MKFGSLFAGIGGFDLGLERAGMACAWQVEIEPYCIKVLEKHWPHVKRYTDIRGIRPGELEPVDLICGGFPCQPVSVAGRRKAQDDKRWLWPEFARIIGIVRPRYVLIENVPGLLSYGMGDVLGGLSALGYDAEWESIPASAVGAPHRRDRVWIVAYTTGRQSGEPSEQKRREDSCRRSEKVFNVAYPKERTQWTGLRKSEPETKRGGRLGNSGSEKDLAHAIGNSKGSALGTGIQGVADEVKNDRDEIRDDAGDRSPEMADTESIGMEGGGSNRIIFPQISSGEGIFGCDGSGGRANNWSVEPNVGRVAHGVPARVHRLKALGNAIVPQIAEWIGKRIIQWDELQS